MLRHRASGYDALKCQSFLGEWYRKLLTHRKILVTAGCENAKPGCEAEAAAAKAALAEAEAAAQQVKRAAAVKNVAAAGISFGTPSAGAAPTGYNHSQHTPSTGYTPSRIVAMVSVGNGICQ